ncbi:MAG: hypothetical protein H0X47_14595 [Nitrospirales bacterium]|nr:hypothetical protein [Nitrospirales bacterium]
MRYICTLGLVGFFLLLGGCASHHKANDEQIDLYLSTLDDKHFAWCELDLEQCRHDFEQWKLTPRGSRIIEAFEQEDARQPDNTHHLPNVFRTRFVEESQFAEEMVGERGKEQNFSQDTVEIGPLFPSVYEDGHTLQEGKSAAPRKQDPQFAH